MLKTLGLMLAFIFTIVASDYIGQHGWSNLLGIPLTIIWASMATIVMVELLRKDR